MGTTKLSKEEFLNLKNQMESYKNKKKLLELEKAKKLIEDEKEKPFIIFKEKRVDESIIPKSKRTIKRILNGGRKHQKVAGYIIKILLANDFKYKTEVAVYIKKIKKAYRLDIFAYKDKRKIAIECGNTNKSKLENLKKYFEIIHISYNDFKILESTKQIEENINKIIKSPNTCGGGSN